ncbi:MAG: CoB--CoM heterodisulfide reductase iron-sulfur subunit A family protein, partial [Longimicrobiales bacterium]|nr:CoB--CoM heterodisulfide reductase iron-sulfur subunit A family protein [Longimicrobiales bacterium]
GNGKRGDILVIGGGISGLTAAIEAAETGANVTVVEKEAFLGGRVARMNLYFPKMCPPSCGLEINVRRVKTNSRIRTLTLSTVESITGGPGSYTAIISKAPRFVNSKCTICGDCVKVCPADRPDDINLGLSTTKAIYLPYEMAYPSRFVIDPATCLGAEKCGKCVDACPYGAIDLAMAPEKEEIAVDAVVWATGWDPPDATQFKGLGFGTFPNVINNVMMERISALNGPTGGKILRPSDGKAPQSIAFVQCAGSRDENYYKHCSGVCCMASLKQARYVREQFPEAQIYVFYIDIRTPGRLEDFFTAVKEDERLSLVKGKVANITEDPATGTLTVEAEDTLSGRKVAQKVDMVVLATGMIPNGIGDTRVEGGVELDEHGFLAIKQPQGYLAAGCAKRPTDVSTCTRDATGIALKALHLSHLSAE